MSKVLQSQLIKWVIFTLVALVLYGVVPGGNLALVVGLLVGVRLLSLGAEALRKPLTKEDWQALAGQWTRAADQLAPSERSLLAAGLRLAPDSSARRIAEARIRQELQKYRPPRGKWELAAEALGVVAFTVLLPANLALFSCDFCSLRTPLDWLGASILAVCVALYAWPHTWSSAVDVARRRILWWSLPFPPALLIFLIGVNWRHPYLNPLRRDQVQLAAERVLALPNNVVAGRHADWVLRYARQLDEQGEASRAAYFYREALRLDANQQEVAARLAVIEAAPGDVQAGPPSPDSAVRNTPYWAGEPPADELPKRKIDSGLERVEGCSVVLVPVGEVAEPILRAVGFVVRQELGLPVYRADGTIPLPPHTRVRGLVTGRQWSCDSLVRALLGQHAAFPAAPIKYVLVTPVDIYVEEAQFVFSASTDWGAVVSVARLGNLADDPGILCHRAAKQTLCALLKSFKVPMSPDRGCVTSYSRTLQEFDAKGNRPNAATLASFQRTLTELNRQWCQPKAAR